MTRLQSVTFQTDTQRTTGLLQSMRGQKLHSGQILQIKGNQFKVFHINPMSGIVSSQTEIEISRCSFNQELQQVQLLNLSAEKKNSLMESLVGRHLSQDEVIEADGLKFQVIYCKPESGHFTARSMYRISNSVKPTVTEVTFSACLNEVQKSSMMIAIQKYYRIRRYVREGSKVIIDDTELYVRQAKPKKGFLEITNCLIRLIDPDVNTVRSMFDEEEELGLQLQVNTLKVLQDKTASRNQFVNKRKKLYSLVEGYASYDEKENCIVLSSRDMQSNSSINEFPNFPNTFLCKLHEQKEEDDLSDLESDLMDADETNCMGALEQNEKLTQMTLPVFFKNILASGRAAGASRQTRLSQPEQPRSRDLSFESSEVSDEGQHNVIEDYSLSDSSLMHEDQPHLTAIPRYFNEIVMFNSNRRLPIVQQGSTMLDQLPERTIDINWIQSKGSQNTDFSRCMICLMDYNHEEVVRTLPCLHYFHKECIDFWLGRSKRCPICKTLCDQFY